jgi:Glycosyl hydrolases family 28
MRFAFKTCRWAGRNSVTRGLGHGRAGSCRCLWSGVLLFFGFLCALHAAPFQVRDFGARADKTTNDTAAIQAAIDACSQAGGGEVVFSAGDYLAGKITLKRNVTLKIEAGATIWASARPEDYARSPGRKGDWYLFVAENQENIAISGDGRIQGVGQADLDRRADPEGGPLPPHRFGIIHFAGCTNVHLREVRIYYSDWHTVTFFRCEKVFVTNVTIINNFYHTNSDGIDPVSCKDVFISNCFVIAGDDAICPKTEQGYPLENLVIDNCILESVASAIKLGTGSSGDFRDIKVSNCVIRNSGVGLGIFIKDGGTAERLSFSQISIETTRQATPINARLRNNLIPIYIDIEQRNAQARVGAVRDVTFSQIQIDSDSGLLIQGMAERAIESLTLRDIVFRVSQGFDFSQRKKRAGGRSNPNDNRITRFVRQPTYMALAYIDGLVVDNVRLLIKEEVFQKFDRSALALFESKNAVIQDVQRQPAGTKGGQPVLALENCQQVLVENCLALPGTPAFLGLSGKRTGNISLVGSELSGAREAVIRSRDVPAGALRRPPR